MSFQAMTWATKQTTGTPSAKLVLLCLANFANSDNGACWPTQQTVADHSEQSIDTVQKRLRDLEKMGYIFRVKQRTTRHAHFTTDLIVLLMDGPSRAYALSLGWDPDGTRAAGAGAPGDAAANADDSPAAGDVAGGDLTTADPTVPQSTVPQSTVPQSAAPSVPHSCGTEQEVYNLSPLTPPEILGSIPLPPKRSDPILSDWRVDWSKLDTLWPWPPDALKEPSRRAFQRLDPHERASALKHAPDFIASRQRNGPKRFFDARRYLSDHGWEPWASGTAQKANSLGVFVLKGTPAWDAWARVKRAENGTSLLSFWVTIEGKRVEGIYRPTLFPRPHVQAGEDSHVANQSPSTGSARMP